MSQTESLDEMVDGQGGVRPHWRALLGALTGMEPEGLVLAGQRLQHAFEDEGVSSVLPGTSAHDHPWRCDPVPFLLPEAEFRTLETGLAQRARLMQAAMADLAGPRRLLAEGMLPPALLYPNPGFIRMSGMPEPPLLNCYAADLVRGADGAWRVLADRLSTSGGIGYARENRRIMARVLPEAFRAVPVRPLRPFFDLWQDSLRRLAPHGGAVALLTSGTRDRRWFEHMFLARELGGPLVEGGDLTVRDGVLYLKTLRGLQRVDVLVRRVDGRWLDPLELDANRQLGVPGLLDAVRAGNLRVVNDPGAGVLEAPGLIGLVPAWARLLLGEELALPGVPSLWLGDPAHLARARAEPDAWYYRPALDPSASAVHPGALSSAERAELARRVDAKPDSWVAIGPGPLSVAPSLTADGLAPHKLILRLFLIHDGEAWRAMPGGLGRLPEGHGRIPGAMPHGELTKDVWALAEEGAQIVGPAAFRSAPLSLRRTAGDLPSRVADNLYWLGRHVERAERGARLARAAVARLGRGDAVLPREVTELGILGQCLADAAVITLDAANPTSQTNMTHALLGTVRPEGAIGQQLEVIGRLTETVRDRLTGEMYATLTHTLRAARNDARNSGSNLDALAHGMLGVIRLAAALAGVASENMVRGGSWIFLDLGRRIERAQAVTSEVALALDQPPGRIETGLRLILELCDSVITYRTRYLDVLQPAPVLDLVLADPGNPRGLAFQLAAMHGLLDDLSGESGGREMFAGTAAGLLAEAEGLVRSVLAAPDQSVAASMAPADLARISSGLVELSDRITRRYFALLPAARLLGLDGPDSELLGAA